ncbi:MAG: EAL domain-containing protein [Brucellaceae bacterium]|nr:EAL domain-containing protein [Brucellaceae bacterium]
MKTLSRYFDRAIGADALAETQRKQLIAAQIQTILEMVPGMTIGCIFVSLLFINLSVVNQKLPYMLVWGVALALAQGMSVRAWLRSRKSEPRRFAGRKAVIHACAHAGLTGSLWGAVPLILLPGATNYVQTVVGIAMTGVLCGSGFALAAMPQAVATFLVPAYIGTMLGVFLNAEPLTAATIAFLLTGFILMMPIVTIRYAKNFTMHVSTEVAMREQKDVISLFLKEFEDNASDWLWEIDSNGRFEHISERFSQVVGMRPRDIVQIPYFELLEGLGAKDSPHYSDLRHAIERREAFRELEIAVKIGDNTDWWRLSGKPTFDDLGNHTGFIGIGSNVTTEKKAEMRISMLAHSDVLTGLMNRAKFTEKLNHAISRLERYGTPFTVLYLDLDRFKLVNDTRGHPVGDKLLASVAHRIRSVVRDSDSVARLGGDEFAIIIHESADAVFAAKLASRLIAEASEPYMIDGETFRIGMSVGIAIAPINGTRPDQILRNADLALYRSKQDGRGVFRFFESQMDSEVRERRTLEVEMRQALENDEFVLHYQPLVSSESGEPTGMEALIRWNHPIRGYIPPSEFIPIAEQSNLIQEIGDWTIREACRAASQWPEHIVVAVNLSVPHFIRSDIASITSDALAQSGLSAERLELEITESLLIDNTDEVLGKLRKIKDIGVTIAMDDFGTGYSSLAYLLKFPFDKIKIDRSFVIASSHDEVAKAILRMISALGDTLGMRITAEGVETREQVEFLRGIACHQLQGFYFAKPLTPEDLPGFFLRGYCDKARAEAESEAHSLTVVAS